MIERRRATASMVAVSDVAEPEGVDMLAVQAAREEFAAWLRVGRDARGMTLDEVARVTRIQQRALERLEAARFDELPADVFVRGFIRNYARCVGLPIDEALRRYGECGLAAGPVASVQAQALVQSMAPLAPDSARHMLPRAATSPGAPRLVRASERMDAVPAPIEAISPSASSTSLRALTAPVASVVDAAPVPSKSRRKSGQRKRRGQRRDRARTVTPPVLAATPEVTTEISTPMFAASSSPQLVLPPVPATEGTERVNASPKSDVVELPPVDFAASAGVVMTALLEAASRVASFVAASSGRAQTVRDVSPEAPAPDYDDDDDLEPEIIVIPGSAPIAALSTAEQSAVARATATAMRRRTSTHSPSLVIDDADPESAEREREARHDREPARRSFLPPILLDDEPSARQGGLTLAVIILLIVATLTLSYLMRRPSSSGEGVTALPPSSSSIGFLA